MCAIPCIVAMGAGFACWAMAALHPVSSGKNWGYGSRVPTSDGVSLDLGRLNRILDFDQFWKSRLQNLEDLLNKRANKPL